METELWREKGWKTVREEGRLLALGTMTVTLGEAGTDNDLVLSMYLSALLRPECLFMYVIFLPAPL